MAQSTAISLLMRLGDQKPVKSLIHFDFLISLQTGQAIAVALRAPTC